MAQPLNGVLNIANPTSTAAIVVSIAAAAAIVLLAGGAFVVASWRRYFRRLFDDRFQPQDDGTYLAYWMRGRGQPIEAYRIDKTTKERGLADLMTGSIVSTGLFVLLIIAAVVTSVLWPTPVIIPGAFALGIVALAPQRRANRQAGHLIVKGICVECIECMHAAAASPQANARSLRRISGLFFVVTVMGVGIVAIFLFDPDRGPIAWNDSRMIAIAVLLTVMPLSVALFCRWALRFLRS